MTNNAIAAACAFGLVLAAVVTPSRADAKKSIWVTGYFPAWQQTLKPEDIDFGVVTHVIYFAIVPKPDGSLDVSANGVNDKTASAMVDAAHKAHRKALISIGGENSGPAFQKAIAPGVRDAFVKNIVDWASSRGFDGVDVDMEPVQPEDAPNFQAMIRELRHGLRAHNPHALITSAVGVTPAAYKPIVDDVDQINIMTYDMAGPWDGWETWYNSALSNGGRKFKSVDRPLPSCETMVADMIAGGIPASKIGIGVCAYGVAWHGAAGPNQPIDGVTTESLSYNDIIDKYYTADRYHWDNEANAPYLSVDAERKQDRAFIAYDDPKACAKKIDYVRNARLGGVIVWELSGAYRPAAPIGSRDPLLSAIGTAIAAKR